MSNFNLSDAALDAAYHLRSECEKYQPKHNIIAQPVRGHGKTAMAAVSGFLAMLATITGSHGEGDVSELACMPVPQKIGDGKTGQEEWQVEGTLLTKMIPVDKGCLVARANVAMPGKPSYRRNY